MRRLMAVFATLAIMAALLVASAAPAFAAVRTIQCSDLNRFLTGTIVIDTETHHVEFNCRLNRT